MRGVTVSGCAAVMVLATTSGGLACAHSASPRVRSLDLPEAKPGVVNADEVHGIPGRQVEELLEGRVAGVRVVRSPDGDISLRIWGPSSIYGNGEPLYVLDGMPLNAAPGQGLSWLDPNDVERIEILKDVSVLAMYGVRGANGVVLITTRRGNRRPD
jgi:TonB-dependent SusC/RagA subfamily outer membrane receptor